MVTTNTIKEQFLEELESAVYPHVSAQDVVLEDPERATQVPAVVYREDTDWVSFNGVGGPEKKVFYDDTGEVEKIRYYRHKRTTFAVTVLAETDAAKAPIEEDLIFHFNQYRDILDATDFHADCQDVVLRNQTPDDISDRDLRADEIEIETLYETHQDYTSSNASLVPIQEIAHDTDQDGTGEYTTQ